MVREGGWGGWLRRVVDWLVGWLVGWLVCRLVGLLARNNTCSPQNI